MDLDYQSYQPIASVALNQNLTIAGNAEVVNIITFSAAFAKAIVPNGTTPTGYAEIFKPGNVAGTALIGTKPPRIMDINQGAGPKPNGLAGYSIATEIWDNGYSAAPGDLVCFTGATNPTPSLPYTAGNATSLSSTLIECETLMRQLARDVLRANLSATAAIQAAYPVGSIYFNGGVATNPATLLGFGTWAPYGPGRSIVCFDSTQVEFDTLGETGGSKTHALTAAEMPEHRHQIGSLIADAVGANTVSQAFVKTGTPINSNVQQSGWAGGAGANVAGNGLPHNNLQPYIVAYAWIRTA